MTSAINKNNFNFELVTGDYMATKSQLSSAQQLRAEKTISDFSVINNNLHQFQRLTNDNLINQAINKLTCGGAEDGFGMNSKMLEERVNLFVQTYLKAKEKKDLKGFFGCFTQGSPCLSGRTESMYKYAASLDNLDIDAMPDPEKSLFFPGSVFADEIMANFEQGTTLTEFSTFVEENISSIAAKFKNLENNPSTSAFLQYLEAANLYQKGSKVDWEVILKDLLQSRYFKTVYEQSLRYVI